MTEEAPDNPRPLVTVGMFVHNEDDFIRDSITSILDQDYDNVEFIIADNASSDGTSEVCAELSAGNDRIDYVRHPQNIGAAENSTFVLERARGRYFMWASGHDLWSTDLISSCVESLERHPQAALAVGKSDWIDADGGALAEASGYYDTRGLPAVARFFFAFWGNLHPVLGVIRMDCLRAIPKIHACAGSDQIVLADLALQGDFLFVPRTSWSRRQPRKPETHRAKLERYRSAEFGLTGHWIDRRLPLLRLPLEIVRAIWRTEALSAVEKLVTSLALPPVLLLRFLSARRRS